MFHRISIILLACAILITVGVASTSSKVAQAVSTRSTSKSDKTEGGHKGDYSDSIFELAVEIIKKYEGLHSARHWPYIGYGHRVEKGESYQEGTVLSKKEAEALLRKDLKKYIASFSAYGRDSVLLGVLAYNLGVGNVKKSRLIKILGEDDATIRSSYVSHCRYKGKVNTQLEKRRIEEFDTLFPLIRAEVKEEISEENVDSEVEKLHAVGVSLSHALNDSHMMSRCIAHDCVATVALSLSELIACI